MEYTFNGQLYATLCVDFKVYTSDHKKFKFQIWDTGGHEKYSVISVGYYRGASIVILVFDVGSDASFSSLDKWKKDIDAHRGADGDILVVGNKSDIEAEKNVSVDKGEAWALENDVFLPGF